MGPRGAGNEGNWASFISESGGIDIFHLGIDGDFGGILDEKALLGDCLDAHLCKRR